MPVLEIKDLSKAFGGLKAVNNFHMTLEEGEIVGLIGPNGAGKTTVFNLITGLYKPTTGSIVFRGENITGLPPFLISQRGIARTFQNIRLFKQNSVLDNVRAVFHPRINYNFFDAIFRTPRFNREEERVISETMELLSILNLASRAEEKAASLPYGDQRRLEIARALAGKPVLLLLDEPAAGMNPAEVKRMVELIREIKKRFQLTILLIEHQMGMVMNLCERLVVMDFGQIIATGTPQEIRNNPVVLEAYLGKGVTVA
ncbi:ATP-binding cassette domain-containing protein [Desulfofundulus thermobenzoicus]|uniref:ATP-binding cassette domain-containing protein n=1 Tax=Desulfofundulus thermobenzoicus TaxID=29376 RepID=A0A6N7IUM1_9FIRM|nr:ABC transporter ATP-binding protein [Desulfofundulus thermobenzoicus]MQL53816.1 ATP-binding cassette domain-containing protein [Desulfofundulus thermobenzoicus]HHW43349.1 ABC transporter ATP-binding protein [Desulfotomaculum sp.]